MTTRLEFITSICAIFVAVVALVVAIYEAKVIRDHQELSVWPYVTYYTVMNPDENEKFQFFFKNNGMGPALVKKITYSFKGKEYSDFIDIFKLIFPNDKQRTTVAHKDVMKVILPSAEYMFFGAKLKYEQAAEFVKKAGDGNLKVEMCYCSLYEQCWILYGKNNHKSVDSCSSS